MKLGKGYAKIYLYDLDEVLYDSSPIPNPFTLNNSIQTSLVQTRQPYIKDGSRFQMANGELREMIKGKRIYITIPIRVVEDVTDSDWENFLYLLYDFPGQGLIKVMPYLDVPANVYWSLLDNGRRAERSLADIREIDTLEFTGFKIIDSIS